MKVNIPANFQDNTIHGFISEIIHENNKPKYEEIEIDFSCLKFIRPSGVTILHNILQWLIKQDVDVYFDIPAYDGIIPNTDPIKYLDDIGFFELYLGEKQFAYSSLRDTTIPLRNISYADHYGWLDEILLPWVSRTLQIYDKKGFGGFKTCIGEIFNNINDHSGEDIGCAFAQYFYKSHEIEIAISDFGVGIPHCIRKKEADCPNDAVALKLAVEEGYTTKTRPTNRGAGLETLSGFVVENNKGNMTIFSNRACLHCSPGKNGKEIITWNTSGFYPGTLIMITLKAGAIYEEIDEEDFLW